jgi:hypothetical protein
MIVFIYKRLKKDIDEARKHFLFLPDQLTYIWRIRMIMLPRQALDKHLRQNAFSKATTVFSSVGWADAAAGGGLSLLARGGGVSAKVTQTHLLCVCVGVCPRFAMKTIVLPRQARDKCRG